MEEVLPRGMYQIRLRDGRRVRGGIDIASRSVLVKVIAGNKVEVRLIERDPGRVQIIRKL